MKFNFRQVVWDWYSALQKAIQDLDIGLLIYRQVVYREPVRNLIFDR